MSDGKLYGILRDVDKEIGKKSRVVNALEKKIEEDKCDVALSIWQDAFDLLAKMTELRTFILMSINKFLSRRNTINARMAEITACLQEFYSLSAKIPA